VAVGRSQRKYFVFKVLQRLGVFLCLDRGGRSCCIVHAVDSGTEDGMFVAKKD
jgi:hypothetical protein